MQQISQIIISEEYSKTLDEARRAYVKLEIDERFVQRKAFGDSKAQEALAQLKHKKQVQKEAIEFLEEKQAEAETWKLD